MFKIPDVIMKSKLCFKGFTIAFEMPIQLIYVAIKHNDLRNVISWFSNDWGRY